MIEAAQRETISGADASSSGLFLNAAVLDFGDATVEVDVLPRANQLTELRRKHRATHVLRAERDSILAVPIVEGAPLLSETRTVMHQAPQQGPPCRHTPHRKSAHRAGFRRPAESSRGIANADTLTLGESELGVDWVIGPSDGFARYAFNVEVARILTALAADLNIYGIVSGAVPAPHSPVVYASAPLGRLMQVPIWRAVE